MISLKKISLAHATTTTTKRIVVALPEKVVKETERVKVNV